jgi:hypothetical protein
VICDEGGMLAVSKPAGCPWAPGSGINRTAACAAGWNARLVRGAFRHPASGATRAGCPPFAREGDEPIQPRVITAKARKAASQEPVARQHAKLLLDEPGQPFSVAQTGGLCPEGVEVIAHHLVHDTL